MIEFKLEVKETIALFGLKREAGRVEERTFASNVIFSSAVSNPICDGISPEIRLSKRDRKVNRVIRPISVGIGPVSRLSLATKEVRKRLRAPTEVGMVEVSKF